MLISVNNGNQNSILVSNINQRDYKCFCPGTRSLVWMWMGHTSEFQMTNLILWSVLQLFMNCLFVVGVTIFLVSNIDLKF